MDDFVFSVAKSASSVSVMHDGVACSGIPLMLMHGRAVCSGIGPMHYQVACSRVGRIKLYVVD
jgi:hypothetical protein